MWSKRYSSNLPPFNESTIRNKLPYIYPRLPFLIHLTLVPSIDIIMFGDNLTYIRPRPAPNPVAIEMLAWSAMQKNCLLNKSKGKIMILGTMALSTTNCANVDENGRVGA